MFEKLKVFLSLFRQGEAVVEAAKLKNKQLLANAITVLLGSILIIAKGFGHELPFSNDDLVTIGGFIAIALCLFNGAATVITSEKVGLPAQPSEFPPITTNLPVVDTPAAPADGGPYAGGHH